MNAYRSDLAHFSRWWRGVSEPDLVGTVLEWFLRFSAGEANGIVLSYRNAMTEQDLASATIARRMAALRSVVALARTLGLVSWSIEIRAPKHEARRDMSGPDAVERKKIWKTVGAGDGLKARRDRAILSLLFDLALRRGEVCALDLADVDIPAGKLAVVGKGKREKQRLDLSPEARDDLLSWIEARGPEPGPLFPRIDRAGHPHGRLQGNGLGYLVGVIGERSKVGRKVRPHGFRHAAITAAVEAKTDPFELIDFSRHAKLQTVMGYIDKARNAQGKVARGVAKERRAGRAGKPGR